VRIRLSGRAGALPGVVRQGHKNEAHTPRLLPPREPQTRETIATIARIIKTIIRMVTMSMTLSFPC
jgi:hypothetical protein